MKLCKEIEEGRRETRPGRKADAHTDFQDWGKDFSWRGNLGPNWRGKWQKLNYRLSARSRFRLPGV